MSVVLMLLPLLPLIAAMLVLAGGTTLPRHAQYVVLATSLLAVLVAIFPPGPLTLDGLLLGTHLAVDGPGRPLLLLAGLLWAAAAIAARPLFEGEQATRFTLCFLLTCTGNLGVIVAQDLAAFYASFAVMTFAAYGTISHRGDAEALRAGRIYIILALIGEAMILAGIFTLAGTALGNPTVGEIPQLYTELAAPGLISLLLVLGFSIKMGVVPLHVWLPLAHPAAPIAASAILSGIIVKAGLLGWVRFVPGGEQAAGFAGHLLILLGLGGAFYAAIAGCLQQRAKTVLAYSTVSQMGLLAAAAGLWLAGYGGTALLAAIGLFALHTGLAKGALFLALDHLPEHGRRAAWVMVLPLAALAGLPPTSGLLAKGALKAAVPEPVALIITLSSLTTALVLIRFVELAWPAARDSRRIELAGGAWLALVAAGVLVPWLFAGADQRDAILSLTTWAHALWPVLLAAGLWYGLRHWQHKHPEWQRPQVPEGDLLVPAERALSQAAHAAMARIAKLDVQRLTTLRLPTLPARVPPEPGAARIMALVLAMVLLLAAIFGLSWR